MGQMGKKCTERVCRKRGVWDKVLLNPFWVEWVENLGKHVYGIFLVKCVLHVFKYKSKVLILCFKVLRVIYRKIVHMKVL